MLTQARAVFTVIRPRRDIVQCERDRVTVEIHVNALRRVDPGNCASCGATLVWVIVREDEEDNSYWVHETVCPVCW